jgi:hypothetical protein
VKTFNKRVCAYNYFSCGREGSPRRPGPRPRAGGRFVLGGPPGAPARVRARMHGAPAKNPVSVSGRGLPPPIGPEINPKCPSKQGTKHEQNNLAARSVLTWYSSSQCPNYAVDFRHCRTSTPVPVASYRSYPPAFHSLEGGVNTMDNTDNATALPNVCSWFLQLSDCSCRLQNTLR